jgi:hypothetical protein
MRAEYRAGDTAFEAFPRHFPRLEAIAWMWTLFIEERPEATAKLLSRFLAP